MSEAKSGAAIGMSKAEREAALQLGAVRGNIRIRVGIRSATICSKLRYI